MAEQVPFKEGCLTVPLSPLDQVRRRASSAGPVAVLHLGPANTASTARARMWSPMSSVRMERSTLIPLSAMLRRHRIPRKPSSHSPWHGWSWRWTRILSEITGCGLDDLDFGKLVELDVTKGWVDDKGNEVMMYKFRLIK